MGTNSATSMGGRPIAPAGLPRWSPSGHQWHIAPMSAVRTPVGVASTRFPGPRARATTSTGRQCRRLRDEPRDARASRTRAPLPLPRPASPSRVCVPVRTQWATPFAGSWSQKDASSDRPGRMPRIGGVVDRQIRSSQHTHGRVFFCRVMKPLSRTRSRRLRSRSGRRLSARRARRRSLVIHPP